MKPPGSSYPYGFSAIPGPTFKLLVAFSPLELPIAVNVYEPRGALAGINWLPPSPKSFVVKVVTCWPPLAFQLTPTCSFAWKPETPKNTVWLPRIPGVAIIAGDSILSQLDTFAGFCPERPPFTPYSPATTSVATLTSNDPSPAPSAV